LKWTNVLESGVHVWIFRFIVCFGHFDIPSIFNSTVNCARSLTWCGGRAGRASFIHSLIRLFTGHDSGNTTVSSVPPLRCRAILHTHPLPRKIKVKRSPAVPCSATQSHPQADERASPTPPTFPLPSCYAQEDRWPRSKRGARMLPVWWRFITACRSS